ncbi:MAG: hypothetical protein KatS3mg031_2405 [Chitinophagales bacterium]|nr:MAG: hypothetical protein KatS3mg031_2405 [Chitinophagales bacterium]
MYISSLIKIVLMVFSIKETTEKGKQWKRVESGTKIKWILDYAA